MIFFLRCGYVYIIYWYCLKTIFFMRIRYPYFKIHVYLIRDSPSSNKMMIRKYYRFSRPFSSPRHSIFRDVFFNSSRTLWNVLMLVSISSLVDQFWNIAIQFRALSPVFVNCYSNSSVTVAEHEREQKQFCLLAFIFVQVSIKIVSQM